MGNLGAEKAKNQGLGWQQGCGGGRIGESPRGKMGKNGESSRGKMGENGGKWGKMGENGEEMGRKWGERGPVAPPKFPYFPPFSPISPHFPPFSPIFPHFSLPWVHCGYVCGYSTRHRSRVLLSPEMNYQLHGPCPQKPPALWSDGIERASYLSQMSGNIKNLGSCTSFLQDNALWYQLLSRRFVTARFSPTAFPIASA